MWLSHAHDLGQAALGAGREAGRPCVLARIVIRTFMYGLRDSTAAASAVIAITRGGARGDATLCACHNSDTYIHQCMGYVRDSTAAAVIGHHTAHAR